MNDLGKPTVTSFRFFELFDGLNDDQLSRLCAFSKLKTCKRGHILFKQGDMNDWVYFIITGAVTLLRQVNAVDDRHESADVVVQIFGQGESVGDVFVLESTRYRCNVRAIKDASLLAVSRDEFVQITDKNYRVLESLYKSTAMKLFKIIEGIDVGYGKIINRIDVLSKQCSMVGIDLHKHFSKSDIARMLGVSRVAVTQCLKAHQGH